MKDKITDCNKCVFKVNYEAFHKRLELMRSKSSFEFVIWFKEDENFLKCYINNEVRYLDRNRYDKWTTAPQLECYFTIKEVYEYWATNVSK